MKLNYKIAIIGVGSIGIRHLQNIVSVLDERNTSYSIDLIRSGKGKELKKDLLENISKIYYSSEEVPSGYDIIFVTNPTKYHFETMQTYAEKTKHMFIEKPVFDSTNINLEELKLSDSGVYYVACPLRYTDVIQHLKHNCDLTQVYSARVICSSYLPDWRPGVDYRDVYSAHKEEGGGVSIDLIHEWDYLTYLFGFPKQVFNIRGQFSDLEINSEDLSLYIAKYEKMAVEVHLDYFGRKPIREIQLFTREDTIVADIINSEIRYLVKGETLSFKETRNDFQRREISYFFDILQNKETNHNNIFKALKTLEITEEGE